MSLIQSMKTAQVSVGTAATPVGEGMVTGSEFHLFCTASGNQIVYIGGSAVTTATGFQLHKDEHITLRIPERVQLYAVADAAGATLYVLQVGGI